MALETFTGWIKDLVSANPTGTDPKSQGDDHVRGIKKTLRDTFSGFTQGKAITVNEDTINSLGAATHEATANALARRNSSGNLSANTFTGNLTGNVTGNVTGAVTGNASTATTLQTARNINGTSFNGSAAITTANWGTARTITIGSTGKSVNGSGNVSWSLGEIGAQAALGYTPANQTVAINTGAGLTGGGNLTTSRTINLQTPSAGNTINARYDTATAALNTAFGDNPGSHRVLYEFIFLRSGTITLTYDRQRTGSSANNSCNVRAWINDTELFNESHNDGSWTARSHNITVSAGARLLLRHTAISANRTSQLRNVRIRANASIPGMCALTRVSRDTSGGDTLTLPGA